MIITNKLIGSYEDFTKYSDTYIETGSCYGDSIRLALKAGFKEIRSVELHEPYYLACKEAFKSFSHIKLYLGKSTDRIGEMLQGVGRSVILLDAHPSAVNSAGHSDLMEKGDKSEFFQDNIIHRELEIILAHRNDHVIIIDDQNLDTDKSYISFCEQMYAANPNYKFYGYDEQRGTHFYKNKFLVAICDNV